MLSAFYILVTNLTRIKWSDGVCIALTNASRFQIHFNFAYIIHEALVTHQRIRFGKLLFSGLDVGGCGRIMFDLSRLTNEKS